MSDLRKAAQQALEALEWSWGGEPMGTMERDAITALRAALAQERSDVQPEQKPVAWRYDEATYRPDDLRGRQWHFTLFSTRKPYADEMVQNVTPLYTAPPQRKPLTDDLTRAVSQCNALWVTKCKEMLDAERETFVEIINDNTDGDGICCADDLLAAIRAHGIGGEERLKTWKNRKN